MAFNLEALDDKDFQKLCQSLLTQEYEGIQCYPVGQADAGRDARANSIYFQVKHVASPASIRNRGTWIERVIRQEKAKVRDLLDKGAREYIICTNVSGTSAATAGSMDKAENALKSLPVPARIWWRDDILRRLDNNLHLKWTYLQGASGPDLLAFLFKNLPSDSAKRRLAAIRAYLTEQYEDDLEIRFKQVQLANDLFALYVDPPLTGQHTRHFANNQRPNPTGAAEFFLNRQIEGQNWVLEGGPGQGKSTVVQFISQIYRTYLLEKQADALQKFSFTEKLVGRLPLKVDLRDYATWVSGGSHQENSDPLGNTQRQISIESYIAARISYVSGGLEFTVADLQEISSYAPILLILDGLDEVAEKDRRAVVVRQAMATIRRLRSNNASATLIVTSRPTAYTDQAKFPPKDYIHIQLGHLANEHVFAFYRAWASASNIPRHERQDIERTLSSKLNQPHLRELTRNPMQLTIFLSLMRQKGASLPDKRTALYENYLTVYLDRESEKNESLRNARDLFESLHEYVAAKIHVDAELGQIDGRISFEDFKGMISECLSRERCTSLYFADLEQHLFVRLGFLVSRTEGLVEFEVQPLREFFAARFLCRNAPLSTATVPRSGSIADRFEVIAGNPYWSNVVRFLAGMLDKGQLPMVMQCLRHLDSKIGYRGSSFSRAITLNLLRDHAFSLSPQTTDDAIGHVIEGVKLFSASQVFPDRRRPGNYVDLALPMGAGAKELAGAARKMLTTENPSLKGLSAIIRLNTPIDELRESWAGGAEGMNCKEEDWVYVGCECGALEYGWLKGQGERIPSNTSMAGLRALADSRARSILDADADLRARVLDAVFSGNGRVFPNLWPLRQALAILEVIPMLEDWPFFDASDSFEAQISNIRFAEDSFWASSDESAFSSELPNGWEAISAFMNSVSVVTGARGSDWRSDFELSAHVLIKAYECFGSVGLVLRCAFACGRRWEKLNPADVEFGEAVELRNIALLFWNRRSSAVWEDVVLHNTPGAKFSSLWACALLVYAPAPILVRHLEWAENVISQAAVDDLKLAVYTFRRWRRGDKNMSKTLLDALASSGCPNVVAFVYSILNDKSARLIRSRDLLDYDCIRPHLLGDVLLRSCRLSRISDSEEAAVREDIAQLQGREIEMELSFGADLGGLRTEEVTEILSSFEFVPSGILALGDELLLSRIPEVVSPAKDGAEAQCWFGDGQG